jgi:ABC-type transport system involved in multi-copper enzyme maturation permease subunit
LILSKPIHRQDFILGKFFGFSATLFCIVFFQALLFLLVLMVKGIDLQPLIFWSLLFTYLKLEILLSIVFFFSTFMSTIMTIMVSLMVYLIAHSFSLLLDMFGKLQESVLFQITKIFQLLFPPLQALNVKDVIGVFQDFDFSYFLFNGAYACLYVVILLFLTVQIFSRKTFEG